MTFLWIVLGGALGTAARVAIATPLNQPSGQGFPVGTLLVNLVGCLAIGYLSATMADASGVRHEVKLALIVGCLGGFTTFSSFGLETLSLLQAGQVGTALSYVLVSNVAGVGLAWLGVRGAAA